MSKLDGLRIKPVPGDPSRLEAEGLREVFSDSLAATPEVDVDEAKQILANSIGRNIDAHANHIRAVIEGLDELRRGAGFVNGLSEACNGAKSSLEAAERLLLKEKADVRAALMTKPAVRAQTNPDLLKAALEARGS